ncbi:MAG: 23S rRNA (uracil(1939)-C(5))-methyltransferase RlmD [Candidatus Rokuibacteriota bacterium]|nr:MAG: 23S rRNA (uracil(1939)-C(5))-methyltransferase RlmD [Candidatus Rokubacteria bacterium]
MASVMAKPRRGDSLELVIDDLAFGGEGVGRVNGYVVFVRGAVPGDRVRAKLVDARSRFGRAVIESIATPSPDRVEPPCPYFGRCGGCRLQHLAYPAQLAFKEKQVRDCLERIGGLGAFELRPILPAPEPYGYRNKMEFTITRPSQATHGGGGLADPARLTQATHGGGGLADPPRLTQATHGGGGLADPPSLTQATHGGGGLADPAPTVVGLHQADRYDVVLDIERCLLQSETMNALLDLFRREIRARGLSVYDVAASAGLLRFVSLREGHHTGEAMVNIVATTPDVETLTPLAEGLARRVPATASVVLNVNAKKASVAVGTEEHLLLGRDHIRASLGGLSFQVSANSFFQTNAAQAERLFAVVEDACSLSGTETVLDLYAGTGVISLLLARRCRWVYGIEVAAAAIADAVRNARTNGIENCTFLAGEVRHVLPTLMRDGVRAEVVVADPPRAGFHPKALHALVALGPGRLVYVSCNPATLARDLRALVGEGYRLEWVQPVDMFPQTPHIEAVARLRRAP